MPAKHVGFRHVAIKNVVVPGDFDMAKRLRADHINTLAASLKTHGQLQPCIVVPAEDGRFTLWAGGDRYAAALLAELDKLWVSIWEADDRGALEMQLVENCHRRHSQQEQAAARQQLIELYGVDVEKENLPPQKQKQEVVKRVAEAMGVKPETVERAERRRRNKDNFAAKMPTRTIPKKLDELGISMSTAWHEWAEKYREPLVTATDHMTRAQASAGRALKALKDCPGKAAEMVRLHDKLHQVLVELRGAVPVAVCPYCKALDGALDSCPACGGTAVISDHQMKQCPRELLETGKHAIIYHYADGGARKYSVAEWEAAHGSGEEPEPGGAVEQPDGGFPVSGADWGEL